MRSLTRAVLPLGDSTPSGQFLRGAAQEPEAKQDQHIISEQDDVALRRGPCGGLEERLPRYGIPPPQPLLQPGSTAHQVSHMHLDDPSPIPRKIRRPHSDHHHKQSLGDRRNRPACHGSSMRVWMVPGDRGNHRDSRGIPRLTSSRAGSIRGPSVDNLCRAVRHLG